MKTLPKFWLWVACLALSSASMQATEPYLDTTLPIDTRVKDLISRMTLAEKITQLGHKSPAISRLGVKSYNYWTEGLHGVARNGLATSFPQPYALAATWDTALIYNIATAISDEARVKNNTSGIGLTYWCPVVNMDRDPRWGREEENFGEDTHLAARLAVNYIKGMQGNDPKYLKTVATAKHFACNNVEQGRTSISSNVDERCLREYYLPVFKACIEEGKAYSIMSAYNAVNGVPCPANRTLLTNILRNEWGFKGFVVSDCDAVSDVSVNHKYVPTLTDGTTVSLRSGTDLNCQYTYQNYTNDAINKGLLKEADIDTALVRAFKARFLLGEFDAASSVSYTSIPSSTLDCQANRDLALLSAQKAVVLLKNQNSFLPLRKDTLKSIAVIGPHAKAVMLGEYSGSPSVSVSPFQGIASKLGIDVFDGTIEAETATTLSGGPKAETCGEGGSEIGYIKNNTYVGFDSINIQNTVDKVDFRVASNSAGGTIQIMLDNPTTGTVVGTATVTGTGGWQVWTTVSATVSGLTGKHKIYLKFTGAASVYLFNLNWFKFYNSAEASTSVSHFTNGSQTIYSSFGTSVNGTYTKADIDSAVSCAKKAQIVVLACGTDENTGSEGSDRSSLGLPGAQQQLVQAVYQANPKTVLVLITGFSLAVNWEQDNLPAILSAWFDGQAQGSAIADVLFGDYNPGGKLASTWYKSTSDIPAKSDYNIRNNRTYMYFKGTPLYPFGYGLSYSKFEYSNLKISSTHINSGETVTVTADIANTSTVDGEEIPQMYIHVNSSIVRPMKQLVDFTRVKIAAGTSQTITFKVKYDDLQYYDVATRTFKVENSNVDVYIGSSSNDIKLAAQISATGSTLASTYRQDPFLVNQAENYENKSATVAIKSCTDGDLCIDSLVNGSYTVYKNFNFYKAANQLNFRLASLDKTATIDVVLDSLTGAKAGTLRIVPTTNLDTYITDSCVLTPINGVHDVYLIFKGSQAKTCRLNWFTFRVDSTKATTIQWDNPLPIVYGTILGSSQLNAVTDGNTSSAVYNPGYGTLLSAGTHSLTVSYAADKNYKAANKSVTLVVNKAHSFVTWENADTIVYGTPLSAKQLNATVTGTRAKAVYSPAEGDVLNAGSHFLNVGFAADSNYEAANKSVSLVVKKAPSSIDWGNPLPIIYGTALSATQLNATVTGTSGAPTYNPAEGSVLTVGTHLLNVEFVADTNYDAAEKTVTIEVTQANKLGKMSSDEINIYPNPINNVVNVFLPALNKETVLTVLSMNGTVLLSKVLTGNYSEIDLKDLSAGTYTIQITSPTQKVSKQIIKQ
jgi:beta-glucosidase